MTQSDHASPTTGTIRVRFFGVLHALRRERGLPLHEVLPVPDGGVVASALAGQLELPLESIEGVFCNHRVHPLDVVIRPGDEIAFVPKGTPGPHRYFLGLYGAGRAGDDR
ncbi:MAG: hypothetical protein CVT60_06370 [Actinobacteria bacterium HGW-Actinobacteria-10]|jgi:molybdopterin converting factor small subunit|nr:MAG: hypothetical protein CVT60_06370 [Actinobacteria bacterium HGW-Actinobacteria-10]